MSGHHVHDDGELMAMVLRVARAHLDRAERGLVGLRGRGRQHFIDQRGEEIEKFRSRLAKAAMLPATVDVLDALHLMQREIEALHDAVAATVLGCEKELERWLAVADAQL